MNNHRRLTVAQVLRWADAHFARTGEWPKIHSGPVFDAPDNTWSAIQMALVAGFRGLPGGSSLARLLKKHRGAHNAKSTTRLSKAQILRWADAHYRRTGKWPRMTSDRVEEAPDHTWKCIQTALVRGSRGLPGGSSLPRLLEKHRGVRNNLHRRLSKPQILRWADAHHKRSGEWPTLNSGQVVGTRDETWSGIHYALHRGWRGLPGGSSLARLLAEPYRKPSNDRPRLTYGRVLAWADEHKRQTGTWPDLHAGPVLGQPGESWRLVNDSLRRGCRGLPGGEPLSRFLARRRGGRRKCLITG